MVTQNVDKIAEELEKRKKEEQDNKQEVKVEQPASGEKIFYSSVAYLQSTDDTILLDRLMENDDFERLVQEAKEYDQGYAIDLENTHATATPNRNDTILVEDEHYTVVYNASVSGSYDIQRKVSEQEVRDTITRYGLPERPTLDVKTVAQQMVSETLPDQLLITMRKKLRKTPNPMKEAVSTMDFSKISSILKTTSNYPPPQMNRVSKMCKPQKSELSKEKEI